MNRRAAHALAAASATIFLIASVGTAGPAQAEDVTFYPQGYPVTGDLTGDGVGDTVQLGYTAAAGTVTGCAAHLTDGAASTTSLIALPVPGASVTNRSACPDLGAVLHTSLGQRLVTGFFNGSTVRFYAFADQRLANRGSFEGQNYPSGITALDFDGDGFDDLYESTDQGAGFSSWYVHGTSVEPLFHVKSGYFTHRQFLALDHRRGIDIVITTVVGYRTPAQAVVVDGATGRTQILARSFRAQSFTATVVDLDHDDYPDLAVQAEYGGVKDVPRYYLNRSRGGRFTFVATTQAPGSVSSAGAAA